MVTHRIHARFWSVALAWVGVGWIGFGCGAFGWGVEKLAAEEPATDKPADKSGKGEKDAAARLAEGQAQVADRFRELEKVLLRMADLTAHTDPRRAALLRQAIAQSKDRDLDHKFDEVVELLKQDRLAPGVKNQDELKSELGRLLELLLSEDRGKRLESEKQRIRDYLRKVNQIIKDQKGLQAETADGAESEKKLSPRQGELGDRTAKLGEDIAKNEGKAPADKKPDDKKSTDNKPDDKKPDDKENGDKKPGDKPADKNSSDKNQAGKSGEGKPNEGKPNEGKPNEGKPSEGKPSEGKPSEGKPSEGKPSEGKPSEGKPSEGKPSEGQPGEGQPSDRRRPTTRRRSRNVCAKPASECKTPSVSSTKPSAKALPKTNRKRSKRSKRPRPSSKPFCVNSARRSARACSRCSKPASAKCSTCKTKFMKEPNGSTACPSPTAIATTKSKAVASAARKLKSWAKPIEP